MTQEQIKTLAKALADVHGALPNDGFNGSASEAVDRLCEDLSRIYGVDFSDLEVLLDD